MEGDALIELVTQRGDIIGALAFVLLVLWRKWLVLGWVYQELKDDKERYRLYAEKGTHLAEEASGLSEREISAILRDLLQHQNDQGDDQGK